VKGEGLGPDIARIMHEAAPWTFRERGVAIKLRQLAWYVDRKGNQHAHPGAAPLEERPHLRLITEPISIGDLAAACGRGCSKRTVQRTLDVLEEAGLVRTIERWKANGVERDKNAYEILQKSIGDWIGKERPSAWDFRKLPEGGVAVPDTTPHPFAASLAAAQSEKGLDSRAPAFVAALRLAARGDRAWRGLARLAALAPARREAFEALLVEIRAAFPRAGAPPPTVPDPEDAAPAPPSPPPDTPAAERPASTPRAPGATARRSAPPPSEAPGVPVTAEAVLEVLASLALLQPLATERDALLIAATATKYKKPILLVRLGLERLAQKVKERKYGPDLPAARAFVRDAREIEHAPLLLSDLRPPAGMTEALDPTPAELEALRKGGLDAIRELPADHGPSCADAKARGNQVTRGPRP
jgi:hypothetical protein